MRSGYIYIYDGIIVVSGVSGYYWPTLASLKRWNGSDALSARYFKLDMSIVYTSGGPMDRWYGFPLRA